MRKTGKHGIGIFAALIVLALLFAAGTSLECTQQGIAQNLIRLHVVAASDSQEDQAVKLQVRDAVLRETQRITAEAGSKAEAAELLKGNLDKLLVSAAEALPDPEQQLKITLQRELFGTRYYDTFALPGGYYDTLRIVIGPGEGKNWWCVVYPQMCTAASTDQQNAIAAMGALDETQRGIISSSEPEYRLRFRSLELLEDLLGWFRGGSEGIPGSR